MTQDDYSINPTRAIAVRMKELRQRRSWSAQRLAEEMKRVGVSWDRSVVANLENERRSTVSVEELLALAYVLGVAPINLLLPVDDELTPYDCTPTYAVSVHRAREWICGEYVLEGQDPRTYFSEVPLKDWHHRAPRSAESEDDDGR